MLESKACTTKAGTGSKSHTHIHDFMIMHLIVRIAQGWRKGYTPGTTVSTEFASSTFLGQIMIWKLPTVFMLTSLCMQS